MFSTKKNVLQTVALLKAYGIRQIVLSPGSRNAPLIQTFTQDDYFECHAIVDERNAAFYALGIIQCLHQPVAVCCTSGSALQNYAPAVSEAFYQQLPLVVISADRAPAWIGQMDGQTLPQAGIFGTMVKKAVNLPEVSNDTDEWYCNRLVNEALIACTAQNPGPVHINVPLSEPLFNYSLPTLPQVRRIHSVTTDAATLASQAVNELKRIWESTSRHLIIVGQSLPSPELLAQLERMVEKTGCVVLCEHLSNCPSPLFISNFDALLQSLALSPEEQSNTNALSEKDFAPDLLITLGGHIVSKRVKKFLRNHRPQHHWHLTQSDEVVDLFQSLTCHIKADALNFFGQMQQTISSSTSPSFYGLWKTASQYIPEPSCAELEFSDLWAVGQFLETLPAGSALQLANSTAVRATQLFSLPSSVHVYCNRGINGIEGSLPCAVGFASVHQGIVYLVIGDLSFFYSLSALWNIKHIKNLRILLLNNGGGSIFHQLPGLNTSASLNDYVSAQHCTGAQAWGQAAGFQCLSATSKQEFSETLQTFVSDQIGHNLLLEVCTHTSTNKAVYQQYDQQLKAAIQNDSKTMANH